MYYRAAQENRISLMRQMAMDGQLPIMDILFSEKPGMATNDLRRVDASPVLEQCLEIVCFFTTRFYSIN